MSNHFSVWPPSALRKAAAAWWTDRTRPTHVSITEEITKANYYSIRLLDTLIRLHFDLPLRSDDPSTDRTLLAAVEHALDSRPSGGTTASTAEEYRQWILSDETAKAVVDGLSSILRSLSALRDRAADQEDVRDNQSRATLTQIRGHIRNLEKQYIATLRTLRESKVERLDVTKSLGGPSALPWIAFLSPTIVTISGYIYATTYFGHFDIDTAMFLSLGDYLSYSLNKLWIVLVCFVMYCAATFHAYVRYPTVPKRIRNIEADVYRAFDRRLLVLSILGTVLFVWASPIYAAFNPLVLWIVIDVSVRVSNFLTSRYLRVPGLLQAAGTVLFICMCLVWIKAKTDAYSVLSSTSETFLVEANGREYDQDGHRMIGAVSAYVFLMDETGQIDVLPQESVKRITVAGNDGGWVIRARRWILDRLPRSVDPDSWRRR